MAQKKQVLDKIARNLEMLGMAVSRNTDLSVAAAGLVVKYEDASIAAPMGGVSPSASPFLGIGTGNPGKVVIETGAALGSSIDSADKMRVLAACAALANDIIVRGSDADARIRGNADNLGLGQ
jgi:hypothetical protein